MQSFSETAHNLRRALWHLRHGGVEQLKKYRLRQKYATITGASQASALPAISPTPGLSQVKKNDGGAGYTLDFPAAVPLSTPQSFGTTRVAVILDDFSLQAWSNEFETVVITPENWRETLESTSVDFLLVESAWAGNNGAWKYHLTGVTAPRPAVTELLTWCAEHEIPSVFWNKEDPPHFEDFLDTAALFDIVFTTDSRMVERYVERLGHNRVLPLAFAAQPSVHNPVRPSRGFHERGVAFAGTYFAHKFPERRKQMDLILSGAEQASKKSGQPFEIYSRFIGQDAKYQFPSPFDQRVVGSLSYDRMLTAYKAHKVFLNVNSVVDSPSMCARRIFEILACGTPVVTTPSAAIPRYFNESQLFVANTEKEAELKTRSLLNSEQLRDRMTHLAQREIWSQHTYAHRAQTLVDAIGLDKTASPRSFAQGSSVSVLGATMRPGQVDHLLESVARQVNTDVELALMTHGFEIDEKELRAKAHDMGLENIKVSSAPREVSLGECLNKLIGVAEGDVFAKMDDDDIYGDHYLEDMVNTLKFSGADVAGKASCYAYLQDIDTTVLRRPSAQHRFTDFVFGPTITGHASVFKELGFKAVSAGEDSDFLRRVLENDGKIYSSDRFNFAQVRSAGGNHTWKSDDLEILANSEVICFGYNDNHFIF